MFAETSVRQYNNQVFKRGKIVQGLKILFILFILIISSFAEDSLTVSLVTCEWEPFYGSKLKDKGFFSKIVTEAFTLESVTPHYIFTEWSKALKLSKKAPYSGLHGAYMSEERKADYLFSLPVYSAKILFIARKELSIKYDGNLQNLRSYKIGVVKGYVYTPQFDTTSYLQKVEATSPEHLLELLGEKKVDCILIGKDVAQYLLQKKYSHYIPNFKALGPSLVENYLYLAISKQDPNHKELMERFNNGLRKLIKSGRLQQIYTESMKEIQ